MTVSVEPYEMAMRASRIVSRKVLLAETKAGNSLSRQAKCASRVKNMQLLDFLELRGQG